MSNLRGAIIEQGEVGANVLGTGDEISGLIISSPSTPSLSHEQVKTIYNLFDAKALGITQEFDTANFTNTYRHIKEFYRLAGEGTELYIMLVPQAKTMVAVLTDSALGANDSSAKKMLIEAEGKIKQLGIALNPLVAPVALNGMNADVYNSIALAQGLYQWSYDKSMPINVFLEGRDYGGNSATVANLRAIANLEAEYVTVVFGQDWKFADGLPVQNGDGDDIYLRTFADLGTSVGTASKSRVNQNIGDNEAHNLTDKIQGAWEIAGLSDHKTIKEHENSLQTLEDKGFVFAVQYVGIAGCRWNGDHTCTPIILDAEGNVNVHSISLGRTMNKAVRGLYRAYIPKVKTTTPVDPSTGKLPTGVVKYFEGIGNDVFAKMLRDGEITFGETVVDADSDLIVDKVLKIKKFKIIPTGNIGEIKGSVNIKTKQ